MTIRAAAAVAVLLGLSTPAWADRALIVAIDTYRDPQLTFQLPGASAADAERMRRLLAGSLGYKDAEIKVLRDSAATRAAMLDGLTSWLGQARPGERAFFYYAGQGYFDRKGGRTLRTILPFDATPKGGSPPSFAGMLGEDEMKAAFAALAGRQVTAVIDSSHSGTVTRAIAVEAQLPGGNPAARTPQLKGTTRSIVVEAAVAEEKQAAADPAPPPAGVDLVVWTAVSPTQVALIDEDGAPTYRGLFTTAFADGIEQGLADKNGNGVISNQELLDYVRGRSAEYCGRHAGRCEMGVTPELEGEGAAVKVAARNPVLAAAGAETVEAGDRINTGKVTPDKVMDLLGASRADDVRLEQIPASPVKLGTPDIRFRVTSGHDGFLILLSVSDEGEVVQLFPNAISDRHAKDGRILAGRPVTVPDPSYGMRFDATSVTKGTVLALVAADPLKLSRKFVTRQIQVIPQDEVNASVLPELAQSLATPAQADAVQENTKPVGRSLATLPYEIIP